VVYGKSLGNGFAISAIVGKHAVMDKAQDTFISSSFWTERVGFVAALKTIEILTRDKVSDHLVRMGTIIGEGWVSLAQKHGLKLDVTEFKPLISMVFEYGEQNAAVATLFIQEMLKRGYLAATHVYLSKAHNEETISKYLQAVDEVFEIIASAIKTNSIESKLETKIKDEGFKRLT